MLCVVLVGARLWQAGTLTVRDDRNLHAKLNADLTRGGRAAGHRCATFDCNFSGAGHIGAAVRVVTRDVLLDDSHGGVTQARPRDLIWMRLDPRLIGLIVKDLGVTAEVPLGTTAVADYVLTVALHLVAHTLWDLGPINFCGIWWDRRHITPGCSLRRILDGGSSLWITKT